MLSDASREILINCLYTEGLVWYDLTRPHTVIL